MVGNSPAFQQAKRDRCAAPQGPGRPLSATVILRCLDGPVEITVQIRVTGITGSNKSGTRPAAGWVRCMTVNTGCPPRSWIDPDVLGPDMLASVGFTQVADGYDFAGNLGDRQGPRDWRGNCDSGGQKHANLGSPEAGAALFQDRIEK
jgi:hypothetical protein